MKKGIAEIKNRIDIVDFIGRYLVLNKSGKNYLALCPFHKEEVPSFIISPEKQIATCFGSCNRTYDVISFYENYFQITKSEALKFLTIEAGLNKLPLRGRSTTLDNSKPKFFGPEGKYVYEERLAISVEGGDMPLQICERIAMEGLNDYYRQTQTIIFNSLLNYLKRNLANDAYDYLMGSSRGLTQDGIERFSICGIKDLKKTIEFLKDSFDQEAISISGLFSDTGYFIFANHKILIPYFENNLPVLIRGRYFSNGSAYSPKEFCKYIGVNNRTGTLSAKRFFNSDTLKKIKPNGEILIVEGEFDAIVLAQDNYPVVAVAGVTNLPNNVSCLNGLRVFIFFDNDLAGKKATDEISRELQLLNNSPIIIKFKLEYKDITEWKVLKNLQN